jgi:hypothetical protein
VVTEVTGARNLNGLLLILVGFSTFTASSFVYEQKQARAAAQIVSENVILTLQNSALGNIEEGQTLYYTPINQSELDDIIKITLKTHSYLHLDSDLDAQNLSYDTYNIVVRFDTVPPKTCHYKGEIACTLSLTSPSHSSIDLDAAGDWTFDFEITITAQSVNSDTSTAVTIELNITQSQP